jgi:hypothetical protein
MKQDQQEATDLIVLVSPGEFRVACRLRTPGYANSSQFFYEFTITCRRETGAECEWDKMICDDWGDWFFYGHTTTQKPKDEGARIFPWMLVDLSLSRSWLYDHHGPELGPNKDTEGNRCWFYAYDIRRLKNHIPEAVVATHPAMKLTCMPHGIPVTF